MPLPYSVATNDFTLFTRGFVQSLEFLKKPWNLPSNFPDLEKVWKIERNSGEMVKSLKFFFQSYNKCFLSDLIFFVLVKSYSISPVRLQCVREKSFVLKSLKLAWGNSWLIATPPLSGFPAKWRLRKGRRNSILTTCHYLHLGGVFDWSWRVGNLLKPMRTTSQIWEVTLIGWKYALTN